MFARIPQACWRVTMVERVGVYQLIKFFSFDPGVNVRPNEVHQLGIELTRFTHELSICLDESDFWSTADHKFNGDLS